MTVKNHLKKSAASVFSLFIVLVVLRCYEFLAGPAEYMGKPIFFRYKLKGIIMDLELALLIGLIGFVLAIPFLKLKKKIADIPTHLVAVIAIVSSALLLRYFLEMKQPLTDVFFTLSSEELAIAADINVYLTATLVFSILGLILLYFLIYHFAQATKHSGKSHWIIGVLFCGSLVAFPWKVLSTKDKTGDLVSNNKVLLFVEAAERYYFHDAEESPFSEKELQEMDLSFFNHSKPKLSSYPFMHNLPDTSSLDQWLKTPSKNPPNIVIIVVESLSTYMFGENANASGHVMPFMDSLAKKSIFFPNFLSTCERTHNVLPAALSSVPNPPNGMQLQTDDYPNHWSLMSLLDKTYSSRFYCGVKLDYCNLNGYMKYHNIDHLVANWEPQFTTVFDGKQNPWGYPDKHLFEKANLDQLRRPIKQPRLDVFLTLSTHGPFMIPDQKRYMTIARNRFKHNKNFRKQQQEALKKPESLATYAYTDDALRDYFKEVKKRPDFENTIFFIFGDHGNHDMLFSELDKFRTGFVIYSPMLEKPKTIHSISTHLDVAPSIINYLRLNYPELKLPSRVPFYGEEFSTKPSFECKRTLPLISNDYNNSHLVMGSHVLVGNRVMAIGKNFKQTETNNADLAKRLNRQLALFTRLSRTTYDLDHIIPKEVYRLYVESIDYYIWKTSHTQPYKLDKSAQFIDVGKTVKLKPKWKGVLLECTMKVKLKNRSDLEKLPKLTYRLDNILQGDKREFLLWKQTRGRLIGKFVPNGWNKVKFSSALSFRDLTKKLGENNELGYHLLNSDKKKQNIKDVETKIYFGK